MTIALIDADILVYRIGFTTEGLPDWIASSRVDESIGGILAKLDTNKYKCYLTSQDKTNFRYAIYPEYKANRKAPKPEHYQFLRDHLINAHNAFVVEGQEADDQLGIDQTISPIDQEQTCICTIDKDLDQIPGWHLNFVKETKYEVSPFQGLKKFYHQLLTGDLPTDNIPGLKGIGEKKADKALANCQTEEDMFNVAKKMYQSHYPDSWEKIMLRNGQLLKIRTREGELWQFPEGRNPNTGVD